MSKEKLTEELEGDETTIFQSHNTTVFPVRMYQVCEGWIYNLFNEIKRTVITQAVNSQCPSSFIASINELRLSIHNDSTVKLEFQDVLKKPLDEEKRSGSRFVEEKPPVSVAPEPASAAPQPVAPPKPAPAPPAKK